MGGTVPLGYAARDRKLVVEPAEAETVRRIFRRYRDLGCVRRLKEELDREGVRPRPWRGAQATGFSRGALYALLGNPVYIGETRHKGQCHPGQHEPIIDRALWEEVRRLMHGNAPDRAGRTRRTEASPLTGKLFDESGGRLTPSHAVKGGRRYRYYVSQALVTGEAGRHRGWRVPARELERCVADAVRTLLGNRHTLAGAAREAGIAADRLPLLLEAAGAFAGDPLDVAERIELGPDGLGLTLSLAGLVGTDLPAIRHVVSLEVTRRGAEMRW